MSSNQQTVAVEQHLAGYEKAKTGSGENMPELTIRTLLSSENLDDYEDDWNRLANQASCPSPFHTFPMIIAWVKAFCLGPNATYALRIIVIARGEIIVAIAPLVVSKGIVRKLEIAGAPVSQYDAWLLDADYNPQSLAELIWHQIEGMSDIDLISFENVRQYTPLYDLLSLQSLPVETQIAPAVDIQQQPDYAKYVLTRNAKSRKSRRRQRRKLSETGTINFQVHRPGPQTRNLIIECLDLKSRWLEENAISSQAFLSSAALDCLVEATSDPKSGALLSILSVGDNPVAYELGFESGGHYCAFLGTYKKEFSGFGPGALQIEQTLEFAFANKFRLYDFLAPADRYKQSWNNTDTLIQSWSIPKTLNGKIFGYGWDRVLRPKLKNVFAKLPTFFRRAIISVLNR